MKIISTKDDSVTMELTIKEIFFMLSMWNSFSSSAQAYLKCIEDTEEVIDLTELEQLIEKLNEKNT